jgi:hypothetical protein
MILKKLSTFEGDAFVYLCQFFQLKEEEVGQSVVNILITLGVSYF